MPRIRISGPVLATLAIWGAAVPTRPSAMPALPGMEQVSWLAGCLEMRSGERMVEEQRMGVRGASMLGMGRTTTSKGLVEYELTLIHEKAGKILFEAHPSGQPPAIFPAKSVGPDSVVFTASRQEYPQTVGYRRAGKDSVVAWIDGSSEGKRRRVEFPYRRVPCTE